MKKIVIKGRKVYGGRSQGEAMVTHNAISGWGGIVPIGGKIVERGHELQGQSFAGRVLVFPHAKGSSGWSGMFHLAAETGSAPAAMLVGTINSKSALGAVAGRIPTVTDFEEDILELIKTGDFVEVDADQGIVTITKSE